MSSRAPTPDAPAARAARVAHSILDAAELATLCAADYGLATPLRAQLIAHGQNDWYALKSARAGDAGPVQRWALRVLKHGSRSPEQLRSELDWQRRIATRLPVAAVPEPRGGAVAMRLLAPEGERFACLYGWIEGTTLDAALSERDAFDGGELLGRLHGLAAQLAPGSRRHDLGEKLARTAAALDSALADEDERLLVAAARRAADPAVRAATSLPQGSLHGDLHFGNLRRDPLGRLWLLDFDDCGHGALCVDLTPFAWRNRCESLPTALDEAFEAGYSSRRALTAAERAALPGLHVARALYLAGVFARDRDILGRVPGFDRPFGHYLGIVRAALARC
jgi:Ser/Thr protein kinase RdoA (MazF antagonist)